MILEFPELSLVCQAQLEGYLGRRSGRVKMEDIVVLSVVVSGSKIRGRCQVTQTDEAENRM